MKKKITAAANPEAQERSKKSALVILLGIITPCLLLIGNVQAEKNILLLMADDLNDWVGAFGGHPQVKTPNLDKFAKKAVVFRNAHCTAPVCLPSRTSMLTGMLPSTSGYLNNNSGFFRTDPAYKDIVTLPLFFKNKGYFAAKAGKIFHLGVTEPEDSISWNVFTNQNGARASLNPYPHGMTGKAASFFQWGHSADATLEATGEWFAANYVSAYLKKTMTKPFFLGYGGSKPHVPWFVPKAFFEMYGLDTLKMPEYLADDLSDCPRPWYSESEYQTEILRTGSWSRAVQAYLACVSFADACIGNVLNALEASPYKDSTIVLIMGDHGFHLGEKGHYGKNTNWEEGTKTFLIIYDPTIAKPGVVDQAVSLQDIYPTLVDLTGNVLPAHVEGRSLKPVLQNPQSNSFVGWALSNWHEGTALTFRTDRWALIRYEDNPAKIAYELYDMFVDPFQHTNLAGKAEFATVITKLSADIDRIKKREAPLNTDIYGRAPSVAAKFSRDPNLANALPAYKMYRLKAYSVNGKLVREFKGTGADIERMMALGSQMSLPQGRYVYRVFDNQDKLVRTVSSYRPVGSGVSTRF